jgi:hypothetical protein
MNKNAYFLFTLVGFIRILKWIERIKCLQEMESWEAVLTVRMNQYIKER